MNILKEYIQKPLILFLIIGFLILTNILSVSYCLFVSVNDDGISCPECPNCIIEEKENAEVPKIKVDIKGYVKKPGVYELEEGAIVNDLIRLAGGLKSGGTTENLNLSKRIKDEDMVVVLSSSQLKKLNSSTSNNTNAIYSSNTSSNNQNSSSPNNKETDNFISENKNNKININTASKEELMTLTGIGESKANSIIEFRTKKQFQTIEDIMQVAGIGESVYEKIKDNITV